MKFSKRKNNQSQMGQIILSNMMDTVLLFFMIVVLGHPEHLWLTLLILFIILILRECFQMGVSLKRYLTDWENLIEIGAIILVGVLLFNDDSNSKNTELNRNIAAFAIVLSWSELITVAARHPRLTR